MLSREFTATPLKGNPLPTLLTTSITRAKRTCDQTRDKIVLLQSVYRRNRVKLELRAAITIQSIIRMRRMRKRQRSLKATPVKARRVVPPPTTEFQGNDSTPSSSFHRTTPNASVISRPKIIRLSTSPSVNYDRLNRETSRNTLRNAHYQYCQPITQIVERVGKPPVSPSSSLVGRRRSKWSGCHSGECLDEFLLNGSSNDEKKGRKVRFEGKVTVLGHELDCPKQCAQSTVDFSTRSGCLRKTQRRIEESRRDEDLRVVVPIQRIVYIRRPRASPVERPMRFASTPKAQRRRK